MPLQKRKTPRVKRTPLLREPVIRAAQQCVDSISEDLGEKVSVSVVVQDENGKLNILTNETDYDRLTNALQSIVAERKNFRRIDQ